jgi:hypothetical protein
MFETDSTAGDSVTLPGAAGDGTAMAADHNGSSQAPEQSPVFEKGSPTRDDPPASLKSAGQGTAGLAAGVALYSAMPADTADPAKGDRDRQRGQP